MEYKDYIGFTKTYVLVHNTGTGIMEDNYVERDVVYETDDYKDAENKSLELKLKNNTKSQIESNWCNNTYQINVNTLSDYGKKLCKEFVDNFYNKRNTINISYNKTDEYELKINNSCILYPISQETGENLSEFGLSIRPFSEKYIKWVL